MSNEELMEAYIMTKSSLEKDKKYCTQCGNILPLDTPQKYLNMWCTNCREWMILDGFLIYKCRKCGARIELTWCFADMTK